jgi:hypothetical protein
MRYTFSIPQAELNSHVDLRLYHYLYLMLVFWVNLKDVQDKCYVMVIIPCPSLKLAAIVQSAEKQTAV